MTIGGDAVESKKRFRKILKLLERARQAESKYLKNCRKRELQAYPWTKLNQRPCYPRRLASLADPLPIGLEIPFRCGEKFQSGFITGVVHFDGWKYQITVFDQKRIFSYWRTSEELIPEFYAAIDLCKELLEQEQ
ncbi:hypothetical protein BI308_23110 [Roseofilum reptotaenium AO1-A]|uniref:Uncharacterized protein n=1 Tax=Roseofilum reptotaenium AO1-A TaxID=1925591 RepID=A0A1L9QKL3_9CYAN|nr:hypothetical protein BI308_23110 [Roseofilum reptotaenium AO1-A]